MSEERAQRAHCDAHGLVYDPETQSGCVLCRKEHAEEEPENTRPRPSQAGVAWLALGALALVVIIGAVRAHRAQQAQVAAEAVAGDDVTPVVSAVPGVADHKGTVMLGRDGTDEDGYPADLPDKLTLQTLLRERRFEELSGHIEAFQEAAEEDFRNETWLRVGIDAFDTADRRIGGLIHRWAKATPASFAPYLARARHRVALAGRYRSERWADVPPQKRTATLERILAPARSDVVRALELHPTAAEARRTELLIGAALGAEVEAKDEILQAGVGQCPSCFGIRETYLSSVEPRWGGSHELMESKAADWQDADNPKFEQLLGFADLDRCRSLLHDEAAHALTFCDQALEHGRHPEFLYAKATVMAELERHGEAIELYTEALERFPQDVRFLSARGRALMIVKRYDDASRDLLLATRLDPFNFEAKNDLHHILAELVRVAYYQAEAGELDAAIATYDRILAMRPRYADAVAYRGHAYDRKGDLAQAEKDYRRAIALEPTHVESYRGLDRVLSQQERYDEVVRYWNRYLKRRPKDPVALLARSGIYHRKGQSELAKRDVNAACQFGNKEACDVVHRFYSSP